MLDQVCVEAFQTKSPRYPQLTDRMLSLHPERVLADSDRFQRLAEDAQRARRADPVIDAPRGPPE